MDTIYKQVADIIKESDNIVFFGGAGVSTECGIPDFRSSDGLYNKKNKYSYPPEEILSHSFFERHADIFYDYIKENMLNTGNILPNKGHKALADLEKMGKLKAVITQNIDCLHQKAGSVNVLELHGSFAKFYCTECGKVYGIDYINSSKDVPKCTCGGLIRPNIVLYEEMLDESTIEKSVDYIRHADVLIVAGTSLAVYPAAGLIQYFKGSRVIFINKDKTGYDSFANIIINKPFAKTMMRVMIEAGYWNIKSKINEPDPENFTPHSTFKGVEMLPILTKEDGLGIRTQYAKLIPSGEISPHTHDVVEVITVIKGSPQILIGGDWVKVNECSIVTAYPGEEHGVRNNTSDEVLLSCSFKC